MFPWDLQTSNDFNLARGQAEHASFGSCLDLAGIMRTHVSKFDYFFSSQQICKPSDYSLCSDWCENMERMHGTRYSKCIGKHCATTKSWRILKDYVDRLPKISIKQTLSQNRSIKLLRADLAFQELLIEDLQQDVKLRIGWTRAQNCKTTSRLAVFQRINNFKPDVATNRCVNRRLRRCSQFSLVSCRWEANHTIITREACLAPRVRFEVLLVTVAEKHWSPSEAGNMLLANWRFCL